MSSTGHATRCTILRKRRRRARIVAIDRLASVGGVAMRAVDEWFNRRLDGVLTRVYRHYGPAGVFARTWATGSSVLWVLTLLGLFLILYYV